MNENPYQVLGVGIPLMLGRERLFERLLPHLTKLTPDHMCIVGPSLFGKSVFLHGVASYFKDTGDHYVTTLYWDLRHGTPGTDDEFRRRFAERIREALQPVRPDLAEYLEPGNEPLADLLTLVFEEMDQEGVRFLAVLDGFDHVLAGGGITRNLWDEMRTLCQKTSLRLVTGSRSRLRELCKSEESRTSDFWEIFYDTPLQVGCFDENDWNGFLDPLTSRGITFDGAALKEIANWTGGVPVLAAAFGKRLLGEGLEGASVSKPLVDRIAQEMAEERRDLLAVLWDDCQVEIKSDLAALAKGDIRGSEVPDERKRELELRGFARLSGTWLRSSCRLMVGYAKQKGDEVANLRRLFGHTELFESNIRGLLEIRLAQIPNGDAQLVDYVQRAIRDLQPNPANSIVWARSIADRGLDLIWKAELPADKSLPDGWESVRERFDERGLLPTRRGPQCAILRLITGAEDHAPVTKFVTKPTCLLVDHIQSVGDYGQHKGDTAVSVSFAIRSTRPGESTCGSPSATSTSPTRVRARRVFRTRRCCRA